MRCRYWILRGCHAFRQHQHQCQDCQRWRAHTVIPKMVDLSLARFGPFAVKSATTQRKRRAFSTRCIYLELLDSMDRRGRTAKYLPGHGTRLKAAISPYTSELPIQPFICSIWKREIQSIKISLHVVLGNQPTTETDTHCLFLHTVLMLKAF
ncbi:hypothetical protein N1851_006965 [Merluccius polli]|uniref:Uncharacterized protein n=1 Tax=Merluccius polli TaxID=89951 RepID=A0AA47N511_MERPO|nr:hypothetical protein N1851_006965 [Merluccius polli]